jgi:hypothetical protein
MTYNPDLPLRHFTGDHVPFGAAEEAALWLREKLGPDLRGRMMTERPMLYAILFPGVDPEVIVTHVRDGLTRLARERMIANGQEQAKALAAEVENLSDDGDIGQTAIEFLALFGIKAGSSDGEKADG